MESVMQSLLSVPMCCKQDNSKFALIGLSHR